jgi:Cu/Ag efflux protein CusF
MTMRTRIFASLVFLSMMPFLEPANAAHVALLAQSEMARGEGEVRKIDKATGKVTIKHGPLEGISMPAMTMVFRPKDAAMLESLKEGDQVKFTASRQGGAFTLESVDVEK